MLINWPWINMVKHLFLCVILLNHMLQLGSADSNGNQIKSNDEMINFKLNTLKQMANNLNLQLNQNTDTQSGQFYRQNSRNSNNIEQLNTILNRIKSIERNITELSDKEGDSENIKIRMNDLENEIENLRKTIDNILKENMAYQNKLEESLGNMAQRLAFLEEPRRLIELEEQLKKGDYIEAKFNADLIRNNDKLIDVMKKVYETEKDIDGYLYFAGIVNNLSRRLLIYQYIYYDIILTGKFKHMDRDQHRYHFLLICNSLKLMNKLDNSIIKMASTSADINNLANNLTADIKKKIEETEFIRNEIKVKCFYESKGFKNFANVNLINNTALNRYGYDNLTINRKQILYQLQFYLDTINEEKIDCWFDNKFLLIDRDMIMTMTLAGKKKEYIERNTLLRHNYYVKLSDQANYFLTKLSQQNYDNALDIYKSLKSNNDETLSAIKKYYNEFSDVESILNFADLLMQNDRAVIYSALYDAINKTDAVNICDMLKLHDRLVNFCNGNKLLTIISNLKSYITLVIKNDLVRFIDKSKLSDIENHWNLIESNYNEVTIYSKDDNKILGKYKFYLAKENGKINCYFNSKISISNFDEWYWKNGLNTIVPWVIFIAIISKICHFGTIVEN